MSDVNKTTFIPNSMTNKNFFSHFETKVDVEPGKYVLPTKKVIQMDSSQFLNDKFE